MQVFHNEAMQPHVKNCKNNDLCFRPALCFQVKRISNFACKNKEYKMMFKFFKRNKLLTRAILCIAFVLPISNVNATLITGELTSLDTAGTDDWGWSRSR